MHVSGMSCFISFLSLVLNPKHDMPETCMLPLRVLINAELAQFLKGGIIYIRIRILVRID